ncbi:unnamed protein product [Lymnaea stagnalis]|uniref:Uncharacterized protein n=1 Tax=Lymnaea stagnalis TaxID=6523 RepID=A0AAV2HD03_LYMST
MVCRVLVVLLTIGLVHSQVAFDDPCTLTTYVSNFLDKDFVLNVTVPQDCSTGTVNWNYPRGSLLLKAIRPGSQEFTLCIEEGWGTSIGSIRDRSGGRDEPIDLPTAVKPACTTSVDSQTALLLHAPAAMLYVTIFNYNIHAT